MGKNSPTGVTLTLHTYQGKPRDYTFTIDKTCHLLGPFEPMTIRTIKVGERAAFYANVMHNVEGANVLGYIHLRKGTYVYDMPIQLLTFHLEAIA